MSKTWPPQAIPADYLTPGTGSFTDFLARSEPHLLPGHGRDLGAVEGLVHGTTIVALACSDGVVVAGDRRATMGNVIAQRDIEKVFVADSHSAIGIAGTAGIAVEMVRLFRLELEHYEKIEGVRLSLDGKANRLGAMIRGNLRAALQGMAVIPLFAGYDTNLTDASRAGRIFSYDVTGGRYEEHEYYAVGSGAVFARSALKKRYQRQLPTVDAVAVALEALYDAADDDTATAGPDLGRRIFPVVITVGIDGAVRWTDDAVGSLAEQIVASRQEHPGG